MYGTGLRAARRERRLWRGASPQCDATALLPLAVRGREDVERRMRPRVCGVCHGAPHGVARNARRGDDDVLFLGRQLVGG
eukprot:1140056-Prymnesium_polylepis.1